MTLCSAHKYNALTNASIVMTAKGAKGDQDGPIKDWASGKPPAAKACDEDGDDNDALAPAPAWHKYLGPLAVLFKAKKKKKLQKDWKTLRNERIAEEQAKEEEDERLKIEKREADRVLEVEEAKKRAAMKKEKGKIKKPKSGETPDKYTSLWLKEAEIEGMLFDETHFIFGSEDHIEEFVEWVEDEATRLTIFGDRIVEEILLAKERMKKEEAEEKNEKSVGPTPPT